MGFGETKPQPYMLPSDYREHISPLDGKSFSVDHFHMAPHHYIKVMSTSFPEMRTNSYQTTHHSNFRMLPQQSAPQASFSYDLSPVEVVVTNKRRRWYDFIVSML